MKQRARPSRAPRVDPVAASPTRGDVVIGAVVGAAALVLYLLTVCPTIYVEDSAEFSTAAAVFGIPHPPGYPLYTVLAGLFVRVLPLGDIGYRANVFSALCGAAAVVVLWTVLRRLRASRLAALAATLCFAVGATFWSQCLAAEVHTLNALLIALTLLFSFEALRAPSARAYALTGLAFGLAVGHRNVNLLYLAPLLPLLERARRKAGGDARLAACALAALAASALIYLYLPLAGRRDPAIAMGAPTTLRRFYDVVSARAYLRHLESASGLTNRGRLVSFLGDIPVNLGLSIIGAPMGFALWARRKQRALLVVVGWLALSSLAFATVYNVPDVASYLIPTYLALALAAGVGFDAWRGRWQAVVPLAALLGLPLAFSSVDLRHTSIARDYGRQLLESAPPGALVVSLSDTETHVLGYEQAVERRRPDAVLVSANEIDGWYVEQLARRYPDVKWPASNVAGDWIRELVSQNVAARPVCFTQPLDLAPAGWRPSPSGLLSCLTQHLMPTDLDRSIAFWRSAVTPSPAELAHPDAHVRMIDFSYALARFTLASALAEAGAYAEARRQLAGVLALRPDAAERAIVAYLETIGRTGHRDLALGRRAEQALLLEPRDPKLLALLRL